MILSLKCGSTWVHGYSPRTFIQEQILLVDLIDTTVGTTVVNLEDFTTPPPCATEVQLYVTARTAAPANTRARLTINVFEHLGGRWGRADIDSLDSGDDGAVFRVPLINNRINYNMTAQFSPVARGQIFLQGWVIG